MSLSEHVLEEGDLAHEPGGVAARPHSAKGSDDISATKEEVSRHDSQTLGKDNPTDDIS